MSLSLTSRIVLYFLLLCSILLTVVGVLSYQSGRKGLEASTLAQVRVVSAEKENALSTWIAEREADIAQIAAEDQLKQNLTAFLTSSPDSKIRKTAYDVLQHQLRHELPGPKLAYLDASIVDPYSGKTLISSDPNEKGLAIIRDTFLERATKGNVFQPPSYNGVTPDESFVATAPIYSSDGVVKAVFCVRLDPSEMIAIIQRQTGQFHTMDAFLVNADQYPITPQRFIEDQTLQHKHLDTVAGRDLALEKSGLITTTDYRGESVIAAYSWSEEYGIGLIVKLDESEALAPVRSFGESLIVIGLLGLFASAIVAALLARSISLPLIRLRSQMSKVTRLDGGKTRMHFQGDELAGVVREFERMSNRVKERTSELATANSGLTSEIDERLRSEARLREEKDRIVRQRDALTEIAKNDLAEDIALDDRMRRIAKTSAITLGVDRVSIWCFENDRSSITCLTLYEADADIYTSGMSVSATDFPSYFKAIAELDIISAPDAISDSRTSEFAESYLKPLGISSMLDAPIHSGGIENGVICHEHIGPVREWTIDEEAFAVAIANLASLALEGSQRQQAEHGMVESEQRIRAITDSAQDAIMMIGPDGLVTYWNPSAERILGYSREEATGKNLHNLIVPERFIASHNEAFPKFIETGNGAAIGKTLDLAALRKDGVEISVRLSLSATKLKGEWHAVGVLRDVSEERRVQEELRLAHLKQEQMLEHSPAVIYHLKVKNGEIIPFSVGPTATRMLGYPRTETLSMDWWLGAVHPEDKHRVLGELLIRNPDGSSLTEYRIRHMDGDYRWVQDKRRLICDSDGEPTDILGVWLDITDKKKAEEEISKNLESMLLQTAALESTANGVAITDTTGKIEWVNPAFSKLTGYSREEVIGNNPNVLKSGKNSESFYRDMWNTITRGKVWHGDLINKRKNGTLYYEEMTITPVRDTKGEVKHYVAIKQDVTANRLAEEELKKSSAALEQAQKIAHMGNWDWDLKTDELEWSDETFVVLGLDPRKDKASRRSFFERIHPDDRERLKLSIEESIRIKKWISVEYRITKPNGTHGVIFSDGDILLDSRGEPAKITGIMHDITARRESESRFQTVVETANDGIILMDNDGNIVSWNNAAASIFGYEKSKILGRQLSTLFTDSYKTGSLEKEDRISISVPEMVLAGCSSTSLTGRKEDGTEFPLEITVSSWESGTGNLFSAIVRDVTHRKTLEDKLTYQTLHDPLTDMANRVLFRDRVTEALKRCRRTKKTIGILFIDLDNFKNVNDTLGHSAGDELLILVAERLKSCLREGDTAARLGGDEFAIIVDDSNGVEGAIIVANRILKSIRAPFYLGGNTAHVGTSIGIATSIDGSEGADTLLQNADLAMYMAKMGGKNQFVLFKSEMHESLVKRVRLETDMRAAIEKSEFEVYYQPIVDLSNGWIVGIEALVRWNHPEYGLIAPADFIQVAEETQLIVELGRWVLDESCMQAQKWRESIILNDHFSLSVNIASAQFEDDGLMDVVKKALDRSGLPGNALVLEITETTMLENTEKTLRTLTKMKTLGIRFAVDDFGTGFSSLSYLQQFPVDILKIDKVFIDRLAEDIESSAVTRAIITIGDSLNLKAIAEGVETVEQLNELRKLGCSYGQGYHFAKPLSKKLMGSYLRDHLIAGGQNTNGGSLRKENENRPWLGV